MTDAIHNSAMIFGEVAVSGIARGPAVICTCAERALTARSPVGEDEVPREMERFDAAIVEAERNLLDLQQEAEQQMGSHAAGIFESHIMLLRDDMLRKEIKERCLTEGINVEVAIEETIDKLTSLFERMENPHFQGRAADFRDIGNRLLGVLSHLPEEDIRAMPQGSILVTSELLPSLVTHLERNKVHGVILERGGQTAHALILIRSMRIPTLIRVQNVSV
ncbi:MAG: hypothetical protein BIFFINMI_04209 [Phycisphaerae bacterium]|nr:hypothetical protein [Phycisphaerae bacterium]